MPSINITVSSAALRLLDKLAAESGKTRSSMAADCINLGLDAKIESANKRAVFLSMESKRQGQRALLEDDTEDQGGQPKT